MGIGPKAEVIPLGPNQEFTHIKEITEYMRDRKELVAVKAKEYVPHIYDGGQRG